MAQGSVTMTGLKEFKDGVEQLPRAVTLGLRAVAYRTAHRVHGSARARLLAPSPYRTGKTAAALRVTERDQMQAFVVDVGPVGGRSDNLPLWLELGTIKMSAQPFLRPSLETHSASYLRECDIAVQRVTEETLR